MRGLCLIALFLAPGTLSRGVESSEAPVLQWFTALGGSGTSTATAVAADSQGNLYIAGNTTSLDLPTVAAAQAHPGGSPLVRIDPASGASQNIYFQGVTGEGTVQSVAVDPRIRKAFTQPVPPAFFTAGMAGIHGPGWRPSLRIRLCCRWRSILRTATRSTRARPRWVRSRARTAARVGQRLAKASLRLRMAPWTFIKSGWIRSRRRCCWHRLLPGCCAALMREQAGLKFRVPSPAWRLIHSRRERFTPVVTRWESL